MEVAVSSSAAVCSEKPSLRILKGGGPWWNWRRMCSRCHLGTGSETCCSGTGRPTTGKGRSRSSITCARQSETPCAWGARRKVPIFMFALFYSISITFVFICASGDINSGACNCQIVYFDVQLYMML